MVIIYNSITPFHRKLLYVLILADSPLTFSQLKALTQPKYAQLLQTHLDKLRKSGHVVRKGKRFKYKYSLEPNYLFKEHNINWLVERNVITRDEIKPIFTKATLQRNNQLERVQI